MKIFTSILLLVTLSLTTVAQGDKKPASPPAEAKGKIGDAQITIKYNSPSVKGREIWGKLVPYGQVWRTGANQATTFTTDKDIKVEGKDLKAGTYALFTIPNEKEWVIIFNKKSDQWGAYNYKADDDVLRVNVKPGKAAAMTEMMTFEVKSKGVMFAWENVAVNFGIN